MNRSPFKFLSAYANTPEDRAVFFGRDQEISELYERVFVSNLLLVYGESGTGKSSLVQCGLGKKMAETDWLPLFIRRHDSLVRALELAIQKKAQKLIPGVWVDEEGELHAVPMRHKLQQLFMEVYKPLFLIFDQFEELFLFGTEDEQTAFYELVSDILQSALQCKIIIVIREEFLAKLAAFERKVPSLFDNRLRLEKMTDRNLVSTIRGTLSATPEIIVDDLFVVSEQILDFLRNQPGERIELANLQVYLDRLYQNAKRIAGEKENKRQITLELIQEIGPFKNVLTHFLSEQIQRLEQAIQARFRINPKGIPIEVLFEFVSSEKTKQPLAREVLIQRLEENRKIPREVIDFCIRELQDVRILNAIEE